MLRCALDPQAALPQPPPGRSGQALTDLPDRTPVGVAVELEPDGAAAGRHDVLDGLAGRVRERHDVAAGVDGAGHLDLAARMEGAERAAGAEEDRGVGVVAEERHRHVDAADVDQAPDAELVLREPLAVGAVGPLVLGAAEEGDVPVVQLLLGDGLEIEDRQRVLRRRDELRRGAALAERLLAERVEDRRRSPCFGPAGTIASAAVGGSAGQWPTRIFAQVRSTPSISLAVISYRSSQAS